MPVLNDNANNRKLNLNYWDGDWNSNYRFLGVRNYIYSPANLREFLFLSF